MVTGPLPGPYDAVVLTGGRSSRLGGLHKPGVSLGGRTIGARVLDAVRDADRTVVVGPQVPGTTVDLITREEPPGAGPVAGLAAGLIGVLAPAVATLGGDLPFLDRAAVLELRTALNEDPAAAAALYVDDEGRDQPLCAVWSTEALRAALARVGGPGGVPLRRVVEAAPGTVLRLRSGRDGPPPWFDCDTDRDLATARGWLQ
jgi:molybdopterin-guanine dinucleotide biosynthesis protein A